MDSPLPASAASGWTESLVALNALEGAVAAGEAMLYNANGLFSSIGTTFNTPNGATVTRREAPYLPVAAVQKTTDNFLSVSTDATARRIAPKEEIARTTTALKSATADAAASEMKWTRVVIHGNDQASIVRLCRSVSVWVKRLPKWGPSVKRHAEFRSQFGKSSPGPGSVRRLAS